MIHWLVPSAAATRPSMLWAIFRLTNGRRCCWARSQRSFSSSASAASSPSRTSTPCSRNHAAPPRAASVVSATACTTRPIPARRMAFVHGPVRPVWWHGSSVTSRVVSCSGVPASRAASRTATSAWAVPAPRWCPTCRTSPSTDSSAAPTTGLAPRTPRAAAVSAARIAAVSAAVNPRSGHRPAAGSDVAGAPAACGDVCARAGSPASSYASGPAAGRSGAPAALDGTRVGCGSPASSWAWGSAAGRSGTPVTTGRPRPRGAGPGTRCRWWPPCAGAC